MFCNTFFFVFFLGGFFWGGGFDLDAEDGFSCGVSELRFICIYLKL